MTLLRHLTGRALWLVLGLAAAVTLLVHRGDPSADAFAAGAQQEVRTAAKYRWDVRVLAGQVAAHLHHEAALARDTTRLRLARDSALAQVLLMAQSVDSLHRAPLTPAIRRYAEACGEAVDACTQRAGLLAQALEGEHAKANVALARAAHADSVIAQGLHATQCKVLLVLPCLSRAHALELGLVAGVVGTLVLVRH